ncbi:MAG: helix-turn-helix transcriptional regulator [Dethiobacteria bacterium]
MNDFMEAYDIVRVGTKIINRKKIYRTIDKLLNLRSQGLSQQEVADRLDLERTFISRVETVGELRKGERVALIGFPVANKEEIMALAHKLGIEFVWLMSNEERWGLIRDRQALDFFNTVVNLITQLKSFDLIILLSSEKWNRVAEAFLDNEVFFMEIGPSPLEQDCHIDTEVLQKELEQIIKT